MRFKRNITNDLLAWKNCCDGTRALLIEGARGVGKTTVAEDFAKFHYKSYIRIDFSEAGDDVKKWFTELLDDTDTLFSCLSDYYHTPLYERKSLIILDEVQEFPRARECVKHLVEDGRYDYIETGSLVSVKENIEKILIPSEERSIKMYPMDFGEFCEALGEPEVPKLIRSCFNSRTPLDDNAHDKAMRLFCRYMAVGGMPQTVVAYIDACASITSTDMEKHSLLKVYKNDILRSPSPYKPEIMNIYDGFPGHFYARELVKYRDANRVEDGVTLAESYFWLADSMICNLCFNCTNPDMSLPLSEDRTYVKCYMADTGLLMSHAVKENLLYEEELWNQILDGNFSVDNGMLFENAVAQMLVSSGHRLYFYTSHKFKDRDDGMEIDFVVTDSNKMNYRMYPVEVRASAVSDVPKSLTLFKEKYGRRIETCIVVSPRNLCVIGDALNIPPYMVFCL